MCSEIPYTRIGFVALLCGCYTADDAVIPLDSKAVHLMSSCAIEVATSSEN